MCKQKESTGLIKVVMGVASSFIHTNAKTDGSKLKHTATQYSSWYCLVQMALS